MCNSGTLTFSALGSKSRIHEVGPSVVPSSPQDKISDFWCAIPTTHNWPLHMCLILSYVLCSGHAWPLALPGNSVLMGFQSPCTMWTTWLEEHSATLPMLLLNWHQLSSLMGFSSGSAIQNPPAKAKDGGSIPGSGKSPKGGNGNPSRKPHEQRSLAGFSSQGFKELDKTEFTCTWTHSP